MQVAIPSVSKEELLSSGIKIAGLDSVRVRSFVDSTGDEALETMLVFSNSVSDEKLRWNEIKGSIDAVRRLVLEKDGGARYVYIRVRRKKELENNNG